MNMSREDAKLQVGEGWGRLIDKIYDRLPEDAFILQIKEKFGGLRFYVANVDMETLDFIADVEEESYDVCEFCGNPGKLRAELSWMLTLCDEDFKRHVEERGK